MNNYKRNTLIKVSLILVLVLLMFSSGYEIYNLKGSSASNRSKFGFQGAAPNGQGQNKNAMPSNMKGISSQSNNYGIEVIIYSVIFLVSAVSLLVMAVRNKIKDFKISERFLVTILISF